MCRPSGDAWTSDFDGTLQGEKREGFAALCGELGFPDCDRRRWIDDERELVLAQAIVEERERFTAELREIAVKRGDSPFLRERMSLCDYVVASFWPKDRTWYGRAAQCKDDMPIFSPSALRCAEWVRENRVDPEAALSCFDAWISDVCFENP